ncbi:MAG: hypothetical protein ACO1NZ_09440 [Adhaeribacter sp.]
MKKLLFALIVLAALISTTLLAMAREAKKPYQVKQCQVSEPASLHTETSGGFLSGQG